MTSPEGILLIDKPPGMTSFSVVAALRRRLGVKKIGHSGTLDPFATGLLVMLVGRNFTKLADSFISDDKEYKAILHLGVATDSYDSDGEIVANSDKRPSLEEVQEVISHFQGKIEQVPPMFSAKKIGGKRLYEMARKGLEVERKPCHVEVTTTLLRYKYPELEIHVTCSKGTYIRSIGHEIGTRLGSYAYLKALRRLRSGNFRLEESVPLQELMGSTGPCQFYICARDR